MAEIASFQPYGQNETLITSIRNIIKDYPFESIINEFLQNADDAGATRFHVIIDERSHPTDSLFCDGMKTWQGPAILMYNNAKFKESDFKSLMQIRVGGKQDDDTKIGKHGLGFNSCYHFTDVPSFISGDTIAFLDPQEKFLPPVNEEITRGIIGSIPKSGINEFSEKDQLVPFEGIEGIDFRSTFEGTLFRIPLRRQSSDISDSVFTTTQVLRLINDIKSNFSSQFLFLRNVETIEMSHIREVTVPLQIRSLWKATVIELNENVRDQRKRVNDDIFQVFQLKIELIDNVNYKQNDHWIIATGAQQNPEDPQLKEYARQYRLRVLGGIAALLRSSRVELKKNFTGRVYSFFQLPDVTHLPFHLNGTWAQGSDRGKLLMDKDDLPDLDHQKLNWNRHILLDFMPKLYCKFLIETIKLRRHQQIDSRDHPIVMFWPFPPVSRNYPKYAVEYGCKVLQQIIQNEEIFQLINDNENSCVEILFKLLSREKTLEFRDLLRKSWAELMKSDQDLKSMLLQLPIWPVLPDPLQQNLDLPLKPASCGHILPNHLTHYRTRGSKIYLDARNSRDRLIFTELGVHLQDIYSYIAEDVDFPSECNDYYIFFLKDILTYSDENILQNLKDRNCFPTLMKNLRKITDLYDYNNYFFRNMFIGNPNNFLHNDLSRCASALSTIGFKSELNQATFIDCAKKIEELQRELNPPSDIRYRGFFMVDSLYKNIDKLGLTTLGSIMKISFVPVFKSLDKPYNLYHERPALDCFENIILFTYKEVAWSQKSLIAEDAMPPEHLLKECPSLGKPDVSTVIEHLRFLYNTIRNDDEWKNNWADTFKHNVYEVYKWLDKECAYIDLSSCIRPAETLFLNFNRNQDPFDTENWVSATDLVLNSIPNEAKYVNPILAKYHSMLKSAGAREIKPPNFNINVRNHDQSYINRNTAFEFLSDQTFPLHDITFIVNDENLKASRYILAERSQFFHQQFTSGRFVGSSSINPATITIEGIETNSMRILLHYIYGQNIDDAIQNRQSTNQHSNSVLYKDLLKLANDFELDHLKELMELRLSQLVNRSNVNDMKNLAETSKARQLKNYCHHFILENSNLIS